MTVRGRFITLEGPEGSGKSTQATRLIERLRGAGVEVVATREPGGTPLGEEVRGLLQHAAAGEGMCSEAELFLFLAARAQLTRVIIEPALARGAWVVCDRFADSTTAYQGYGRGCDLKTILAFNEFATNTLKPDLTLLLDIDVALGFERLAGRGLVSGQGRDRIERADRDFHERLRKGYLELARLHPERFKVLDARHPPDELAKIIWETIADEFDT